MDVMQSLIRECRSGIPPVVRTAAGAEGIDPAVLARAVAAGRVVIPVNPRRNALPCPIGEGCRVRVNVNVGTSGILCDQDLEVEKAKAALAAGADTLMDLSTAGDLRKLRKRILALPVPVGTVPVYEAVRRAGSAADVDA